MSAPRLLRPGPRPAPVLMAMTLVVAAVLMPALPATAQPAFWPPRPVPPISPPSVATPSEPAAISRGPDGLQLVAQSVWAGPSSSSFQLHLRVSATDPGQEQLAVLVYGALSARSQFQAAVGGTFLGGPIYDPAGVPLTQLTHDPAGGVDVTVPLGTSTGAPWPPSATGIYPVQLFLESSDGARLGTPLDTFLVYAAKSVANLTPLQVAVVLPLAAKVPIDKAGQPGAVPSSSLPDLEADAAAAERWRTPVTLKVDVPTVQALQQGTSAERAAVGQLQQAVRSGDQLLPSTELPVNLGQMEASGFSNDISLETGAGLASLGRVFGQAPSVSTWAFLANVGPSAVQAAMTEGATRFVLPETDLAGRPANAEGLTFAQPTFLRVGDQRARVVGADPELSRRVGQAVGPSAALVGYQVLAELAMIDLEKPSVTRGVVVMPPAATLVGPTFVNILLAGLRDNPLLTPCTVDQLFARVSLATTGNGRVTQTVSNPKSSGPMAGVQQIAAAEAALQADAATYGPTFSLVPLMDNQLFVALSSAFSAAQREAIISGVLNEARDELHQVRFPPATSITLTSRQGQLPLTVVSTASAPMKVLLVLTSEQLGFKERRFSQGRCFEVTPGTEHCLLTISHTITFDIPVVVRGIGTFPIALVLETPNGAVEIGTSTDTVRSTAFSDVGLGLMVGAAVFLGVWWVRNARHGRRARKLVPRPGGEATASEHAVHPAGQA